MKKRIISMLLVVSMLCGLCACGKTASANEMKLVKTEGAARVTDEKRVEQRIQENMNLYSGYGVRTEEHSFAWMNLDFVKLLKLNESSNAVLEKDGRKLKVVLQSGDMFFCVLEELEKDESLTLETGNISMAIRGTCGIVRVLSDRESQLVLLEGKVTVTDTAGTVRQEVETGQVLNLYTEDDGTASVTLREVRSGDILDFAREYIGEDIRIQDKIQSGGGTVDFPEEEPVPVTSLTEEQAMEVYADVIACAKALNAGSYDPEAGYAVHSGNVKKVLGQWSENYEVKWQYVIYDVNHDDFPELLMGFTGKTTYRDGMRIQGCWTTDGTTPIFILAGKEYLEITSNGYVVNCWNTYANAIIIDNWDVYPISTDPNWKYYENCAAYVRTVSASGWPNMEPVLVSIGGDEYQQDNVEYQTFANELYPFIPAESLDWHPLT